MEFRISTVSVEAHSVGLVSNLMFLKFSTLEGDQTDVGPLKIKIRTVLN